MQYNDIRRAKVESDLIFQFQKNEYCRTEKKLDFIFLCAWKLNVGERKGRRIVLYLAVCQPKN